mmetsp:Transcript_22336/g.56905  ORF Transcript_22336/g.56905 Transcript_22336/m.56905 type:complete len:490 (-) Transcript_22336:134-1603(-)
MSLEGELFLRVTTFSGTELAAFTAIAESTIFQATRRVAELAAGHPGQVYELIMGSEVLDGTQCLAEALGQTKGTVELQAVAQPAVILLGIPGVLAGTQLPTSGDVIIATAGHLGIPAPVQAKGHEDSAPEIWLWRLTKSSSWRVQDAELLSRVSSVSPAELKKTWDFEKTAFEKARAQKQAELGVGGRGVGKEDLKGFDYETYSYEELQADQDDGCNKFPERAKARAPFLHTHDDRAVLLAWNRSDWFGGIGLIKRLDPSTGDLVDVARISDLWAVTTDPSDGSLFCTTCYDGFCVQKLAGAIIWDAMPPDGRQTWQILAQPLTRCHYGLAFDRTFGALVLPHREAETFAVLCPQGSDAFLRIAALEGVTVVEALRPPEDDRTPGDRSSPWQLAVVRAPGGAAGQLHTGSIQADGGYVTFLKLHECQDDLGENLAQDLCRIPLLPPLAGWGADASALRSTIHIGCPFVVAALPLPGSLEGFGHGAVLFG